jgi:hypothetical protein
MHLNSIQSNEPAEGLGDDIQATFSNTSNPSDPNYVLGLEDGDLDQAKKWLDVMRLLFHNDTRTLLCRQHARLLSRACVVDHLLRRHTLPRHPHKSALLGMIIDSVLSILGAVLAETMEDVVLPESLDAPLEIDTHDHNLKLRYQCPHCLLWIAPNGSYRGSPITNLRQHISREHPGVTALEIKAGWCQEVTLVRSKVPIQHVFTLPRYSPSRSETIVEHPFTLKRFVGPPNAVWCVELGWEKYRPGQQDRETYQRLVQAPLEKGSLNVLPPGPASVEGLVCEVRGLVTQLMNETREWVGDIHATYTRLMKAR